MVNPVLNDTTPACYRSTDLALAKKLMENEATGLCIVKDGKTIFVSKSRGISGFLEAMQILKERLGGASVGDRVVGKAVALLCVDSKVGAVYASTLSRDARQLLDDCSVHIEWGQVVESILDAKGRKTCPFESLASEIVDPKEAYSKLRTLQCSLRREQEGTL